MDHVNIDTVALKLEVHNAHESQQAIAKTATEIDHVTREVEKGAAAAGRSTTKYRSFTRGIVTTGKESKTARSHLAGYAKGLLAVTAGYASFHAAHTAIDATVDLGRESLFLQRNLGLSKREAGGLAAQMHVLGIQTRAGNQSLGIMSKNVSLATTQYDGLSAATVAQANEVANLQAKHDALSNTVRNSGKRATLDQQISKANAKLLQMQAGSAGAQADAFQRLGVSQEMLRRGDAHEIFVQVADGLSKMHGGTEKTATSMALFGRGWQTLQPILKSGRKGLEEGQAAWERYGTNIDPKQLKAYIREEHELHYATLGLSIALGTQLLPALTKGEHWLTRLIGSTKQNSGAAHTLGIVYHGVGDLLGGTFRFFDRHERILDASVSTVTALTAGWIAWKASMGVVGAINVVTGAVGELTAGTMALDGALLANPIGLIVASAAVLGVSLGLLYAKNDKFHRGVDATFSGIRSGASWTSSFVAAHWATLGLVLANPFVGLPIVAGRNFDSIVSMAAGLGPRMEAAAGHPFAWISREAVDEVNKVIGFLNRDVKLGIPIGIPGVKRIGTFTTTLPGAGIQPIGGGSPRASAPRPLSRTRSSARAVSTAGAGGGGGFSAVMDVPVQVLLDGDKVGDAVARRTLKVRNRR